MKKVFVTALLLAVAATGVLRADSRLSPVFSGGCQSNGMLLRGLDAATYNPALLSFSDGYHHSINLFPLNVGLESSVKKSVYDDYFSNSSSRVQTINGKSVLVLTPADRQEILDEIGDGVDISLHGKTALVGFQLNNEAYALNVYNHLDMYVPGDLWDFALLGNDFNKTYKFDDTRAEMYNLASAEYTFSDKLEIRALKPFFKEVTVGATFRYMFGFPVNSMKESEFVDLKNEENVYPAYMQISNVEGKLLASDITDSNSVAQGATNLQLDYDVLISEAGHGIGMDVGAAVKITDDISAGISINNLISGISWYHNNRIYRYRKIMNGILPKDAEDSGNLLDETEARIIDTLETRKFFTSIPAELNLGFAWHFVLPNEQHLTWTAGYTQQFTDENGATYIPRLATGCEYQPVNWFKARTGIMGGGTAGFGSAIGFGFYAENYAFDLGVENKYLFAGSSKGVTVSLGQKLFW